MPVKVIGRPARMHRLTVGAARFTKRGVMNPSKYRSAYPRPHSLCPSQRGQRSGFSQGYLMPFSKMAFTSAAKYSNNKASFWRAPGTVAKQFVPWRPRLLSGIDHPENILSKVR